MPLSDDQVDTRLEAFGQAFQDGIIAARLPAWMRTASEAQIQALGEAMDQSLASRQRADKLLSRIESLQAFTRQALGAAMQQRLKAGFDVERWDFLIGQREVVVNQQPVGVHLTQVSYRRIPLLEAALRNFTAAEASQDGQEHGSGLVSGQPGEHAPLSAVEFAALCRELDLGGRYQQHLEHVLGGETPLSLLADAQRCAMLVDAHQARIQGVLGEQELQLVAGLCRDRVPGRLEGAPVIAKRLQVLGCDLCDIVVLDVIDEGLIFNSSKRVLVYIPGDPHGPWSAFESLQHFARAVLGQRLRKPGYRRFFSRFVRRRDSQTFFSTIIAGYQDLADWANIDLHEYMRPFPGALFESLAAMRIGRIKDDAAMIAVPVAKLDRAVQRVHDQRLAAEGWALLGLAGFFVPAIGMALLGVTVWELLGQVFHGVEAWQDGDTLQALKHLVNVARDLAVLAGVAAGVVVVRRSWDRCVLVDSLVPAQLEDGTVKLWNQDLTCYRSQTPPDGAVSDAAGVLRHDGKAWITMEGHHYRVRQRITDRRWQLVPPMPHIGGQAQPGAYAPLLRHNGAGAWRLWSEQPGEWADARYLFRRLGADFHALDDEQVDLALRLHGLGADDLRGLHVHGQAPEAGLVDTVQRMGIDLRIRDLVRRLRSGQQVDDPVALQQLRALPGAGELPDPALAEFAWRERRLLLHCVYEHLQAHERPACALLRRCFPGLHGRAAQALLAAASTADHRRLLDTGRIPLRLAEAARACALQVRAVRVCEALYLDTPQDSDLARVVIGLLDPLHGTTTGVRWQLYEGGLDGPRLLSTGEEGSRSFDLVHLDGTFTLLDGHGARMAGPGELFEVLAHAYDDNLRSVMGIGEPFAHNLRVSLGRQALLRRAEVHRLLRAKAPGTWLRLPQRQADGRIGYPLSGRGPRRSVGRFLSQMRARALLVRLRDLYPTFSEADVRQWADALRQSGRDLHEELARLDDEIAALENSVFLWAEQPADGLVQQARDTVGEALSNCWRRQGIVGNHPRPLSNHFRLTVQGMRIGRLPDLPGQVSFSHVTELLLMDMELEEIPPSFWQAFARLQVLDLGGNHLSRVPPQLMRLAHLHELILINNRIVLDGPQAVTLSRCVHLVLLDLSCNPLGRTFSLARLDQLLRLDLRDTRIAQLPDALLELPQLVYADLRDNRINVLPAAFQLAPVHVRRRLRLAGNPCDARRIAGLQDNWPADYDPDAQSLSPRQLWSEAVGAQHRGELLICWGRLEDEQGGERLFRVLRQLLRSEGFRQHPRAMAHRVLGVLRAMAQSPELRQQLFDVANDEWGCQDGASWCFDNLEVSLLAWRAQAEAQGQSERALLRLGRQLWRLEEVDRIAIADTRDRGLEREASEVGLAYRIGLRQRLDLPINTEGMSYPEIAGVDGPSLERACDLVMARETQGRLASALVDRPFWQAYLERTYRDRFVAADAPFQLRLATVLEDESLPEGEQLEQSMTIRHEQQAARRTLMLALTQAALETASDAPREKAR